MKKLWLWILGILAVALVAAFILFRPVPYHVERSKAIAVPVETAFAAVHDLNQWPKWSPWLAMEPSAEVTVSGDGKAVGDTYTWKGELVGEGEVRSTAIDPPKSIQFSIRFIEPFASTASIGFRIEPSAPSGGSTATWLMDGKIPFVMKSMMATWIGMDYDRGLEMLKEFCETGSVTSETIVEGVVEEPAFSCIGVERQCPIGDIGTTSGEAFTELDALIHTHGIEPTGDPLSIYPTFDFNRGLVGFVAAYPVKDRPADLPEGIVFLEIPAHSAFKVVHLGPFKHVANGWSTGMQHLRVKGMKQSGKVMPYERFTRSDDEVPEAGIRTAIYFPLK